jgi:hypothetical protein
VKGDVKPMTSMVGAEGDDGTVIRLTKVEILSIARGLRNKCHIPFNLFVLALTV